ncbi:MAG: DUF4390 domain-containing protein [Desulfotignum sp.]|nr:DUF4390 domain-containing protein [Desulfotignum sp.]MCF8139242.1 DUF4390 domain-containing protein [Desulfotignum sp.]
MNITRLSHQTWICLFLTGIFLAQFLTPALTLAKDKDHPVLTDIKLANTRDDLLIYFEVENAFSPKIIQRIENGILTPFSFHISLYKTGGSWLDKKITEIDIQSTMKYNSLKQEYTVSQLWKEKKPLVTKSFDEARDRMTRIDNLIVAPLTDLVKGEKYQIRIRAQLTRVTLPFALRYVFYFVSFWDIETDWYVINFTY